MPGQSDEQPKTREERRQENLDRRNERQAQNKDQFELRQSNALDARGGSREQRRQQNLEARQSTQQENRDRFLERRDRGRGADPFEDAESLNLEEDSVPATNDAAERQAGVSGASQPDNTLSRGRITGQSWEPVEVRTYDQQMEYRTAVGKLDESPGTTPDDDVVTHPLYDYPLVGKITAVFSNGNAFNYSAVSVRDPLIIVTNVAPEYRRTFNPNEIKVTESAAVDDFCLLICDQSDGSTILYDVKEQFGAQPACAAP